MVRNYKLVFVLLFFSSLCFAQTKTYSTTSNGSGSTETYADAIGVFVQGSVNNGKLSYYKINNSGPNNNPCYVFWDDGNFWDMYSEIDNSGTLYWYYWAVAAPDTFPLGSFWSDDYGTVDGTVGPTSVENTIANITFVSGSGFTPDPPTPNTNNNVIGKFQLTGSSVGGVLQSLVISLTGTRSGINSVKLWCSPNDAFDSGEDIQLSSKSDATSITFDSFNSPAC